MEIQRLNASLATAEQELADIEEVLDDLRSLEDITEKEEIQAARLSAERDRKEYVCLRTAS